jgi:hypothetical protein
MMVCQQKILPPGLHFDMGDADGFEGAGGACSIADGWFF